MFKLRHRQFPRIIHIPLFLCNRKRHDRTRKPDSHKEWLLRFLLQYPQALNRMIGHASVGISRISDFRGLPRRATWKRACIIPAFVGEERFLTGEFASRTGRIIILDDFVFVMGYAP